MQALRRLLALAILPGCFSAQRTAQAQKANDWPQASPEQNGLDTAILLKMESSIRSGDFKKIGSVLIARHGKLIYEAYFDGDASTLRDTRPATKNITDVLVGIAIQERKLDGVEARIFELLPQRASRVQNPDPRKQ